METDQTTPVKYGNCFSVTASGGGTYQILNFYVENLEKLFALGLVDVRIGILDDRNALIIDHRIGDRWYRKDICSTCSPIKYLSLEQVLSRYRKYDRGDMKYNPPIDSSGISIVKRYIGQSPTVEFP